MGSGQATTAKKYRQKLKKKQTVKLIRLMAAHSVSIFKFKVQSLHVKDSSAHLPIGFCS